MKKNKDILISVSISSIGFLAMLYLYSFTDSGNHWELFGTKTERFLITYKNYIPFVFSFPLLIPLIRKRNKSRFVIAFLSVFVFLFMTLSLNIFLD
ncbi:MAG TPA: hypothetical protein DDZ39_08855 [Flavobacteriaceae bacterium]|nr:hypothetical protein [Flavobacteriaceae bacterium]